MRLQHPRIAYQLRSQKQLVQKGYLMSDTVRTALWVPLHAKPGKEAAVESFLKSGLALVQQEPATTAWFAVKLGPSMYGIFDVFPDEAGRQAHLDGAVAKALMAKASELLAEPPKIEKLEVLAEKLPSKSVKKAA
jgi:quinol monooxygenase YgiN